MSYIPKKSDCNPYCVGSDKHEASNDISKLEHNTDFKTTISRLDAKHVDARPGMIEVTLDDVSQTTHQHYVRKRRRDVRKILDRPDSGISGWVSENAIMILLDLLRQHENSGWTNEFPY